MSSTLMIIEDDPLFGRELAAHFEREGWQVALASTLGQAERELFEEGLEPIVVLADMNLPDGHGLDLLEKARSRGAEGEWIFLTGYGKVPDSVRALRLGAIDYLEKPCDWDRLDLVVAGAARSERAQRRLRQLASAQTQRYAPRSFAGHSPAAQGLRALLEKLLHVPISTLILTGETGTGKGLVARILHHSGLRANAQIVELNCAALPRDLLEAELFGHEAGAFTGASKRHRGLFEQAAGGTLFLDEIGEMSLDVQAKLLKAVEDRTIRRLGGEGEIGVDVQLIAATNRDLETQVREGTFRSDLFHRLNFLNVPLPSLRERKEDLEDLVPLFVSEFNAKANKSVSIVPPTVWRRLAAHDWPGNVRELRNVIERCVLFAENEELPEAWLQLGRGSDTASSAVGDDAGRCLELPLDGSMTLERMERAILEAALERCDRHAAAAARLLGTTRETLRYRIKKYRLKD